MQNQLPTSNAYRVPPWVYLDYAAVVKFKLVEVDTIIVNLDSGVRRDNDEHAIWRRTGWSHRPHVRQQCI
jgi:hypothetical protein